MKGKERGNIYFPSFPVRSGHALTKTGVFFFLSDRVNFATYEFRLGCRSSLNGNMGKNVQNDYLI